MARLTAVSVDSTSTYTNKQTASGLVLGGNAKFHSKAKTVLNIIIDTANEASDTIYNATGAMKNITTNLETTNGSVGAFGLPTSTGFLTSTSFLASTSERLDSKATDIRRQAKKNRQAIDKGLSILYILTTVSISLNLIAVIALSGDTCPVLEDFQQDPYNNSLSSIVPCDELLPAKSILHNVSSKIYDLVNKVNRNISISYGNIVQVCNPFSAAPEYEYQPENCPPNAIQIGDIPRLLKMLTCPDSNNGTCNGGISISSVDIRTVEAYSTTIQQLLDVYPAMESLVECQMVKDAISEILHKHCKPLKKYVRMVWAAVVLLSVAMGALVIIWTADAHHELRHHFSDGSVKPHFTTANILELGTTKATTHPNSLVL
ncbi:unnamed protein product [Ilex paraguariensis]|uniref:Uncharacterized protein n=1 Tax=Ilex paraguariensis TaxID=185542 RepID=A0ABC8UXZ0_9AQUA